MDAGELFRQGNANTEGVLDSMADGIFTVDNEMVITFFNQAAERITGISAAIAIGRKCSEIFHADVCETDCPLTRAVSSSRALDKYPVAIDCDGGNRAFISVTAAPMKDRWGSAMGGIVTFRDLSLFEEVQKNIQGSVSFENIVTFNPRMMEVISLLPPIADSESTVLIEGESGTGKDLVARAIHNLSSRKGGPFVVVNCGALPDTLLESELFGYEAGAFTDAKKDKPGRFAQADGGSIFLDEIGDVSPALQVRLLRVLQERSFEPLGSTRTSRSDVRVIAATNKNLAEEVKAGRFRQDLYYRVKVILVTLPPLRERKEDIIPIAENFIRRMNRVTGKKILGLSPRSIETFLRHEWPGNVRELENVIEHAFILCPEGLILNKHLPVSMSGYRNGTEDRMTGKTLDEIQTRAIQETLVRHNGNISASARELGIDRSTLWRKMKRLKIRR